MADIEKKKTVSTNSNSEINASSKATFKKIMPDVAEPTEAESSIPAKSAEPVSGQQNQAGSSPSTTGNEPGQSTDNGNAQNSGNPVSPAPQGLPQEPGYNSSPPPTNPTESQDQPAESQNNNKEQTKKDEADKKNQKDAKESDKTKEGDKKPGKGGNQEGGGKTTEGGKPISPTGKSDISPSLSKDFDKNKYNMNNGLKNSATSNAKDVLSGNKSLGEGAKDTGKQVAKEAIKKKVKQMAAKAAQAALKALASLAAEALAVFGWPVLIPCAIIGLILILIFAGLACSASNAYFGKSSPIQAGPEYPSVKELVAATEKVTKPMGILSGNTAGNHQLDFLNQEDFDFLKAGKIDKRLADSLNYIVQKNDHVRISHIVSGYTDIKTDPESGAFHDTEISRNMSAHKDGLAADIDEIGYVKDKCSCGKEIPVKVSWQIIDENPYGQAPDALNQIKGPGDIVNDNVKGALEKLGVKGLGQSNLVNKMNAIPALAGITGPYDLTKPEVIDAFNSIGVSGLNNESLQSGLKRVQALQSLYDLPNTDMNAISDPAVQQLMNNAGIPVSPELVNNVKKFKAVQTLQNISSLDELNNSDVQDALKTANINVASPDFKKMLGKLVGASKITESKGSNVDKATQDAMAEYGISGDANGVKAKKIFQTAKSLYDSSNNGMISDIDIISGLEQLSIDVGNPDTQDAVGKMKASYTIFQPGASIADPEVQTSLQKIGVPINEDSQQVIAKYQVAQQMMTYQGDYTDPAFLSNVQALGVTLDADSQTAISKYKASQVLADVANKKISPDSPEAKEAFKTIGATKITDPKAKSAVNVGNAKNPNDPKYNKDKQAIGLEKPSYEKTLTQLSSAKNLLGVYKSKDFNDPVIQESLSNLGIKDPKYAGYIGQMSGAMKLYGVRNISDLNDSDVQASLAKIGVGDKKTFEALGKVGSLQAVLEIKNVQDLGNPYVIDALNNLGVKDKNVINGLGKIGSVYSLLDIHSAWDLARPDVAQTLTDLKIIDPGQQSQLGQAGSIFTLTQVKSPMDLATPQSLEALDNLGIIDMNDQLLGQIGAVSTLLNIKSPTDLLNPDSILALNSLGILSLSNPVTAALMAVSFIDSLTGGKIIGAITGQCKGDTKCYKPTAQTNVHRTINDLLEFPYVKKDENFYKITQIITFSKERDVTPFAQKVDALYGKDRPTNSGLFAMPEYWDHLHIGY